MRKPGKNLAASLRARLLAHAKAHGQPFDLVLTRFVLERFLYRLGKSPHRDRYVLKGAMLLSTAMQDPYRPTRDLDLLGFGDPDPETIARHVREICIVEADDGVSFDLDRLSIDTIRPQNEYGGLRIRTLAIIDGAKVPVLVDIGFGDAVEPGVVDCEFPSLLGLPTPILRAYSFETVIAEKFQAMVALGHANTRLKDYYDVWALIQLRKFEDDRLVCAIAATFERRRTALPADEPDALSPSFAADPAKQRQWAAFVRDVALEPGSLPEIVEALSTFLLPLARAAGESPLRKAHS